MKKSRPETTEGMFKPQMLHVDTGHYSLWQKSGEYFIADKDGKIVWGPELARDYATMKMIQMNLEEKGKSLSDMERYME